MRTARTDIWNAWRFGGNETRNRARGYKLPARTNMLCVFPNIYVIHMLRLCGAHGLACTAVGYYTCMQVCIFIYFHRANPRKARVRHSAPRFDQNPVRAGCVYIRYNYTTTYIMSSIRAHVSSVRVSHVHTYDNTLLNARH